MFSQTRESPSRDILKRLGIGSATHTELGKRSADEAVLILVPSLHHSPHIPLSGYDPRPYQSHCNMSDQPGVYHFQVLFEYALRDYERQTGITLANHPLAEQLQTCQSADFVIALLQTQLLAFGEFRESDKIMGSLKNVVSVLSKISATAALGQDFGMVSPSRGLGIPRILTLIL